MASPAASDHPQPQKHKMWVLKVSIHCEGCKRKVKKILQQVPGVYEIDIDIRQQKVVVIGDVHGDTLLKKLIKSGKNAELLPPQPEAQTAAIPAVAVNKPKESTPGSKQEDCSTSDKKEAKQQENAADAIEEPPAKKTEDCSGGEAKTAGQNGGGGDGGDQEVKESKSEGKKPETGEKEPDPPVSGEKDGEIGGGTAASAVAGGGGADNTESGSTGKTKKKKGQKGNFTANLSSSADPAVIGMQHEESGPHGVSLSANHNPPHHQSNHQYFPYGPQYHGPTPVYAVSYNTANPGNSTTSYYSAPPTNSYAYTYPGPVMEPPPSDLVQPHQPLDSFELFSDENPNGCLIM